MNIFILEDDLVQQQSLKQMIQELCKEENIEYNHLIVTAKPSVILENLSLPSSHNLYFLDMEINEHEETGLEVAETIRKTDPYGTIAFITTHSEMIPLTFSYKVSALDFIEKDQAELAIRGSVRSCLALAAKRVQHSVSNDAFILKNKYTNLQLPYTEIYYFETTGISHKLRLVTEKKVIEFYGELKEIEEMDDRLIRCHRAFVININNVTSIDRTNKTISFPNGDTCFVSRRLIKAVLEKMNQ